ncbi:MAG: hypothetical protein KDD29_00800 [Flavobacteriales bacterium]|nr:hypothetical protein [Flavobacteriales bacterium]MCB9336014.1 hypothetical protein [Flavobacteriales bacterium]
MFKQLFLYSIFLGIVFSLSLSVFAQKQKVLVVPYTRFQLVSDFQLEEIASFNNCSSTEVFDVYQTSLSSTLTLNQNNKYELVFMSDSHFQLYKRYIQYKMDKFNGKNFNGSDLSSLPNDVFKELLSSENADFILFINWYQIKKAVHTTYTGDRNKRNKFSQHFIDFDVYNSKKEKIYGKGNLKLDCGDFPSASMVENKCLNAKELSDCYSNFFKELDKIIP